MVVKKNQLQKNISEELVKEEEAKKVGLKEMMFMSLSALIFYSWRFCVIIQILKKVNQVCK